MHPSQQHPPYLIEAVCASIGGRWGTLLRQSMEDAPIWLPWVALVDHGDCVTSFWSESERDVRTWLKEAADHPNGEPWAKYDIEGRMKRALKATLEAELQDLDWDAEFQ